VRVRNAACTVCDWDADGLDHAAAELLARGHVSRRHPYVRGSVLPVRYRWVARDASDGDVSDLWTPHDSLGR
jgi:hypothetical protein